MISGRRVVIQHEETFFNEVDLAMITYNESLNIQDALKDIYDYVDDIIIIDGGSTDNTVKLIKELSDPFAKIKLYKNDFFKSSNGILGDQKNLAISKTNSLFCLFLDPDERLSEDLKKDLRKILRANQEKDVIDFARFNYINNKPEDFFEEFNQLRLFKSFCRYVGTSHHELVGWRQELKLELDKEKYYMIHNKEGGRAQQNWNFYADIDEKYPHKNNNLSRLIEYEV